MENVNGHRGRKLDEINITLQQLVDDKKNNGNRRFLTKEEHQIIPHLLSQVSIFSTTLPPLTLSFQLPAILIVLYPTAGRIAERWKL